MARSNVKAATHKKVFTHEGAPAYGHMNAEQRLRRSVMSCFLFEKEFYEDGQAIADRIEEAAKQVRPEVLAAIAIEAREVANLRHVPLLLLEILTRVGKGKLVGDTIGRVIQRADELGEFVAIYTHGGDHRNAKKGHGRTFSKQMRRGLALAFTKFKEYHFGKYDRDGVVKLRDVLRIARPKPANREWSRLYKRIVKRTLETPDTWEVYLSAGADKRATFDRLIREGQLGYLALLRNLRNMAGAGVDPDLVSKAIIAREGGAQRVLPFRYVAAARAAPQFEPALDQALIEAISEIPPFKGKTVVLVDVSNSMEDPLSAKSDLSRKDAAATLASIIPGDLRVFTFTNKVKEVAPRRGMAGIDVITNSQPPNATYLFDAVDHINENVPHDRLIVITDEQATGDNVRFGHYIMGKLKTMPKPACQHAYVINVASAQNGVGYGPWKHIDGFSEGVLRWIHAVENQDDVR